MILFVVFYSINIFAAAVSDNDGSAFISKPEFDSLKNTFQTQIDNYNTNIDNKIDAAIASYLAGINFAKTSTKRFAVGGGENVVIVKSDDATNLKFAKANIDFSFSVMCIQSTSVGSGNNQGSGIIQLSRDGEKAYELFCLDKEGKTFDYYDNKAKLVLTGNWSFLNGAGFGSTTSANGFALRWHASPWKKAIKDRTRANTQPGDQVIYYDDRFDHIGYVWLYATNTNWGSAHGYDYCYNKAITSVNIENENKTKYIFDNASSKSKIWVWDPTVNKDRVCASPKGMYTTTNQRFTLPDGAGVETSGKIVLYINYYNSNNTTWKNNIKVLTGFSWTDSGQFHTSSGTDTADDWYEFHLAPGENDESDTNKDYNEPKNIKNSNYSEELLSEFKPYGFTGKITEGLPIGVFKDEGNIEFEIDTTTLEEDSILAIKTTPFTPYTENIDNITTIQGISNVKIDGVKKDNCANKISAGKHKISFDFNFEGDKAIYYKLAWPSDSPATVRTSRGIMKLPKEYSLTQK